MWCANHENNLENCAHIHFIVNVHVFCVEGSLGLGGHVVIGVASLHHAYAIPSVDER